VSALAKSVTPKPQLARRLRLPWIHTLAGWFSDTEQAGNLSHRTHVGCAYKCNKPALFLPPAMASNQPRNLRYLHRFAALNKCLLIEDRRSLDVKPLLDKRNTELAPITQASIELLQQTGMRCKDIRPSDPNVLAENKVHVPLTQLIKMAAKVVDNGKRIVVLPKKHISQLLGGDTHPIIGYAAKVKVGDDLLTVSYFDSPKYRMLGYRCGDQFVCHLLLGGGPLHTPELWAHNEALADTSARFQLYRGKQAKNDMGLLTVTQFIQLKF